MTRSLDRPAAAPPLAPATERASALKPALAIAALAIAVRAVPAALSFGTSDVLAWDQLARLFLDGENFYATQLHNWPVLWIYFTAAAQLLHDTTQLPFHFLVKLPPIAADAAIAALLCTKSPKAAIAYALNPVSILVTGYHGQFDALMLAPTVLAWLLFTSKHQRWQLAALSLGIGIWFKPVPLVLLPIFLLRQSSNAARASFITLALAPATIGTLPYFLKWPADVAANFLGYSSWFGQWGYPVVWMLVEWVRNGTIPWWLPDPDHVSTVLKLMYATGRFVLLGALAFTWWWTWRRNATVLQAIVTTFAAFYAATVGFGVQYLLWIIPFALVARERMVWPFTLSATLQLLVAYTLGLAYRVVEPIPDNGPNEIEFIVKLASLPTWVICIVWTVQLLRRRA